MSEPQPEQPTAVGWVDDVDALLETEDWASRMEREQLVEVLEVAYELGVEFGPLLPGGRRWTPDYAGEVPVRFAHAQKLHARDIARASYTSESNQVGPDGFALTIFPMDFKVKNLYRPRRAIRGPR